MLKVQIQQEILRPFSFYFFVNTKSGNQKGRLIMKIKDHNFNLYLNLRQDIRFKFIDLFDQTIKQVEINNLKKQIQDNNSSIKIIICGGDGTVNWVINQLAQYQVDMTKMAFGLLPIGTGNDLCRSLGWSIDEVNYSAQIITKRINQWLKASQSKYDIWDVTIQAYSTGQIHDIRNKTEYVEPSKKLKKMFLNYVGMGLDGRVVYTMQKYRTQSATINKILYGLVGCFNNFCRPMKQLRRKISQFFDYSEGSYSQSNQLIQRNSQRLTTQQKTVEDQQLKTVSKMISQTSSAPHRINHVFKKGFKGMVFLNCTSYMCGLRKVWQTSSLATKQDSIINIDFLPQDYSDSKIQIVAYKNEFMLAIERIMRGGSRVAQGSGPFQIFFRQSDEDITYIQIDGESLTVNNLKSIKINKTQNIKNHQIIMMTKPQQY